MVELPNITVRQSLNNFSGLIATRRNVDLDYEKYHRFNLNVLAETVDADRLQEHTSVIVYGINATITLHALDSINTVRRSSRKIIKALSSYR